jgi:hypothetical protein
VKPATTIIEGQNQMKNFRSAYMTGSAIPISSKTEEYATMQNGQVTGQQIAQANAMARQAILATALRRQQQIFQLTFAPSAQTVVNIVPRYTGLILGFWIEIDATSDVTVNNAIGTAYGPANLLQQVRLDDLSNNTRVQTTGRHLTILNSLRGRAPFLAARTNTTYPLSYGNVFNTSGAGGVMQLVPSTLTTAGGTAKAMFWLPCSYSELDLRGAIYASVVNATMNIQLTLATSAQAFAALAGDPTNAVYQYDATGAGGTIDSYTVRVHQVYYDQLPVGRNGVPMLPVIDLSTLYMIQNTTMSGLAANADFPIPYANFRSFLSTYVQYANQTGGAYPAAGADINYWQLQSANFTNIFNYRPNFSAVYSRLAIGDDFPLGAYVFNTADKPINTSQFGNMELIINPLTVNAGAQLQIGWESFAISNTLVGAASLAGGGG